MCTGTVESIYMQGVGVILYNCTRMNDLVNLADAAALGYIGLMCMHVTESYKWRNSCGCDKVSLS